MPAVKGDGEPRPEVRAPSWQQWRTGRQGGPTSYGVCCPARVGMTRPRMRKGDDPTSIRFFSFFFSPFLCNLVFLLPYKREGQDV